MPTKQAKQVLEAAIRAGQGRDYAQAVNLLTALLAEVEAPVEAHLYLGRSYQALGETGKAIEALRRYLAAGGDRATGFFFLGRAYLQAGRHEEARSCLKRSAEADPDRAQTWALLGAALLKERRSKAAVACLERAVGLAPADRRVFRGYLTALFVRAVRLIARGDTDLAAQMLGFVIENGLDAPGPRLWRARALRELGRPDSALIDCEAALKAAPEDRSLHWLRTGLLLEAGRHDEAREEMQALDASDVGIPLIPKDGRALARIRTSLAFREERWSEALAEALALLRSGPEDAALRAIAAESLRELGQYERARAHWERAIAADPEAAYFRLGLALTLWELGEYAAAKTAVDRARRLGADPGETEYCAALIDAQLGEAPSRLIPRIQTLIRARGADPRLMFALGEALYRDGRPDLASGWFEKVLTLVPDHELSLLYRASVAESLNDERALDTAYEAYLDVYPDNQKIRREYLDRLVARKDWDKALKLLETGLAYGGSKGERRLLAAAYRNTGRFREAAMLYRELLREDPANTELLLALSLCLERDGKGDYALALLEKAPEAAKREAAPWIVLGLLLARRGRTEAAIDALRKATELEPRNARAWRDLGRIYERQGLSQFAAAAFERAEALDPSSAKQAMPQPQASAKRRTRASQTKRP